jgi:hypothetical protein
MSQELVNIRVELDPQAAIDLNKWADREGRSKRRHAAVLLRRLTVLQKTNPNDLRRLGLMVEDTSN